MESAPFFCDVERKVVDGTGPDSGGHSNGSVHVAIEQTREWIKIDEEKWLPKVWLVPATEIEVRVVIINSYDFH